VSKLVIQAYRRSFQAVAGPVGALTELLQQAGIGELRLLGPALAKVAQRQVVAGAAVCAVSAGIWRRLEAALQLVWIRSDKTGDALLAAEKVLRGVVAVRPLGSLASLCRLVSLTE
jgi:hypothetical protein